MISRLLFPVGAVLVVWLIGAFFWIRRPQSKFGPILLLMAGAGLWVLSPPLVGWHLLHGLESRAGQYADPDVLTKHGVTHLVVLSGGRRRGELTSADRLAGTTLRRLLEGIRLWRQMPGCYLVLSGGAYDGKHGEAEDMAALARELGVPPEAIILETSSWDTGDQARLLSQRLKDRPFALITSAAHIPRCMMIFKHYGLTPFPAPADFRTRNTVFDYNSFLPNTQGLRRSETAIHEYIGMLWYRVRGLGPKEPELDRAAMLPLGEPMNKRTGLYLHSPVPSFSGS